eukprot:scaffold29320_cov101-Isochrysis_galbana.AAC.1
MPSPPTPSPRAPSMLPPPSPPPSARRAASAGVADAATGVAAAGAIVGRTYIHGGHTGELGPGSWQHGSMGVGCLMGLAALDIGPRGSRWPRAHLLQQKSCWRRRRPRMLHPASAARGSSCADSHRRCLPLLGWQVASAASDSASGSPPLPGTAWPRQHQGTRIGPTTIRAFY